MKAAVYQGDQQLKVEEIPTPNPNPNQVLVKVKYCAICGTDVHAFLYDSVPSGVVMGHEYCGTIAKVGHGVTNWREGERVLGGGGKPPHYDLPVSRTHPRFNYRTMGFSNKPVGAYAEYVIMEKWSPLKIPDGVSDEMATLCEPCGVAIHAVRKSDLKLGDSVAVIGAGPIGLFCIQAAKAAGATAIYVSEPVSIRRKAALAVGANFVVNPDEEDAVSKIVELTQGVGPNIVFDCAGIKNTFDQSLSMVKRSGQVVLVALAWTAISVIPVNWIAREIKVQAVFGTLAEDWIIALDLMQEGKITVEPLLAETSFIPLEDIQKSFEALIEPTHQLQVVVCP